jgi:phosphate transport system permease protein
MKEPTDFYKGLFFGIAAVTALLVFVIIGFLLYAAAPVLTTSGIGFITGSVWNYDSHQYGILIFLVDSILLTALTLVIAVPFGILTAMYLAEWAPVWMERILRPLVELLVGIPSVVYGFFGLLILSNVFTDLSLASYHVGLLLTAIVLAIMVIPTIVALSQDAMRGVPDEYRDASIALGATRWETVRSVVIPAAFPGIVTSVVLAMMRAMGETMAVVMLLGNNPKIPASLFDQGYTMTAKILNDILYYVSFPEPRAALFGIAVVIFLMEMLAVAGLRLICSWAQKRSGA